MADKSEQPADQRPGSGAGEVPRRFRFSASEMLPVLSSSGDAAAEPMAPDDPEHAIGRRITRVNVEEEFATVYLTFEDGTYLAYAARIDEEGVILLDRFSAPAADYSDYWIFDELEGETGPQPLELEPKEGSGFHPSAWQQAVGLIVSDLGWDEEGMQAFVHFAEGGYLTLAARAKYGSAFLPGYFSPTDPEDGEYMEFDPPDADHHDE